MTAEGAAGATGAELEAAEADWRPRVVARPRERETPAAEVARVGDGDGVSAGVYGADGTVCSGCCWMYVGA